MIYKYSFFETTEYDYLWGSGDNDNYINRCVNCDHTFRGHKRALSCRKCHEESKNKWNSLTEEQRNLQLKSKMEAAAKFFKDKNIRS
jgi:hypothetical protein